MDASSSELDLALAEWRQGQPEQALARLDGIAAQPEFMARACAMQASILHELGRDKEALMKAFTAIESDPLLPEAWECAALLLIHHRKWEQGVQMLALGVQALPEDALLHAQYALCLVKTGALDLALAHADKALHLRPDFHQAIIAKIEILWAAGYYDLAHDLSLTLNDKTAPNAAAYSRGSTAFMIGDFARGMKLLGSVIDSNLAGSSLPRWNGKNNPDAHVVFYGSQGHGDRIHFVRYLDAVRHRIRKTTLLVPEALARLMRESFPDLSVVTEIPKDATMCCPLTDLPNFLEGGFDPLAGKVPYLRANLELSSAWREKLAATPKPRIGLVWSSDSWYSNDPVTLISFDALKPLVELARPHLVSLQMGEKAKQAANAGLFDASPFITDFADSASLINELDLLITLDSAPLHLAGALGKPVWMMSPFRSEWRWLVGREDSIWYPSLRLFRMDKPEDWMGVVERMCADIKKLLGGDRSVLEPVKWQRPALQRHPHAVSLANIKPVTA